VLVQEIFSYSARCETNCSLDERENVSALLGKLSLCPLWDQCSLDRKRKPEKRKNECLPWRFSHTASTETNCLLDEKEKCQCSTGNALTPLTKWWRFL